MPYLFDGRLNRYRDVVTGRIVSVRTLIDARDNLSIFSGKRMQVLGNQVATGQITSQQFIFSMRRELKTVYLAQYEAAVGGRANMVQADFGRVGGLLKKQYEYLNNFANEMAMGRLTPKQAEFRAQLYANSSTQAFERGKTALRGIPNLPQYPGDGRTQCRTNCKCEWSIMETENAWECTWRLNPAEHCDDCLANAATWNPLVISK